MKRYQDTDYYVTETGEVWSKKYHRGHNPNCELKQLKSYKINKGYLMVNLTIDEKKIHKLVHRLVGEVFILNPENYSQINHIDGDKLNNHVSNLEWCTASYNIKHSFEIGLNKPSYIKGEKHGCSKLTNEQVLEIRELYSTKNYSQRQLGKKFGVALGLINNIINRKNWKHL